MAEARTKSRQGSLKTEELSVNSDFRFGSFFGTRAIWVKDITTGVTQPFLLSQPILESLEQVVAGKLDLADLDSDAIDELHNIGIVFSPSSAKAKGDLWMEGLDASKSDLHHQGWTIVKGLYNPSGAPALRKWITHNRTHYSEYLVKNRIEYHNDILCKHFHSEFYKVLFPVFPESIKKSYCFLGIYHDAAELPKHVDRDQCRWNVSVIFDSSPEITDLNDCWPIYLETTPNNFVQLRAVIGDAIIYRGNKIPHWREPLPSRFSDVSICFFHYVREDFPGSLD